MRRQFKNITGSLNALLVLEAAVRHGSFTKAGEELSLTQPTVSRHIATLEARIGRLLFRRDHNQIQPTDVARALADAVSLGLGHAESVWERLAKQDDQRGLVLACSFTFAENWLLPRFSELRKLLGDKTIRITTFDWLDEFDNNRADLAVVWGRPQVPGQTRLPLFAEQVYPVCSPEYLRDHPDIVSSPNELCRANLLHLDVGDDQVLTWRRWFAARSIEYTAGQGRNLFDSYPFLLRAVQSGEGIGLGWRHLTDRFVEDGSLVCVGPTVRSEVPAYYLQIADDDLDEPLMQKIIDWFKHATDVREGPDSNGMHC